MGGAAVIRQATGADYPEIIARVDDWWGGRAMQAMVPRLFFTHFESTSFVATREDKIVGFLCGFVSQTDPTMAYVHFIGVDPAIRGAGIGASLYHALTTAARAAGCREVQAVTAPTNAASIAFHCRLGFRILPGDATTSTGFSYTIAYDGPNEDRVRLQLRLSAQSD